MHTHKLVIRPFVKDQPSSESPTMSLRPNPSVSGRLQLLSHTDPVLPPYGHLVPPLSGIGSSRLQDSHLPSRGLRCNTHRLESMVMCPFLSKQRHRSACCGVPPRPPKDTGFLPAHWCSSLSPHTVGLTEGAFSPRVMWNMPTQSLC